MKYAFCISMALVAGVGAAQAAERLVRFDDASLWLPAAIGKQVDIQFSEVFAAARLAKSDFSAVVLSGMPDGHVCFFSHDTSLDPANPKLTDLARADYGDICVPRGEVSVKTSGDAGDGTAAMPFYSTDKANCVWSWKSGNGIGLWTEDCTFETGRWDIAYDAANDLFALQVDGGDPFPVLRHFHLKAGQGPDALLPELKAKGLVLDDPECVFEVAADQAVAPGWTAWQVKPTGKRKEAFEAQPSDEVPEPPCGELGYAVDYVGYFAVNAKHPDRLVFVNLGQDGTMIDPGSITFN